MLWIILGIIVVIVLILALCCSGSSCSVNSKNNKVTKNYGVTTIGIFATTERLIVRDHFKVGQGRGGIHTIDDNFYDWFFDKIEEPIGLTTLQYEDTLNICPAIIDGISENKKDKENRLETNLAVILALMGRQRDGKKGALLLQTAFEYSDNIFYVRDINNILRAVDISYWGHDRGVRGWHVHCYSIDKPFRCNKYVRIFSRATQNTPPPTGAIN